MDDKFAKASVADEDSIAGWCLQGTLIISTRNTTDWSSRTLTSALVAQLSVYQPVWINALLAKHLHQYVLTRVHQCSVSLSIPQYPLGMVQSAKGAPDTYTDFSPSGSGPSTGKKYAVETESPPAAASVDEGNASNSSEESSSSAAIEEVADSAYEAPNSKKKCSNKKRRSMLVKRSAKRHRRRSAATGARAARHVRSNLKGAVAL